MQQKIVAIAARKWLFRREESIDFAYAKCTALTINNIVIGVFSSQLMEELYKPTWRGKRVTKCYKNMARKEE